jgi:hypothetical protein
MYKYIPIHPDTQKGFILELSAISAFSKRILDTYLRERLRRGENRRALEA